GEGAACARSFSSLRGARGLAWCALRTDPTDRTDRTSTRDSLENGDCHHFPEGTGLSRMPRAVPPPSLSGKGCGGKWWLSPFSSARNGFFASLGMTQGSSAPSWPAPLLRKPT